jgi:hypothetical protein
MCVISTLYESLLIYLLLSLWMRPKRISGVAYLFIFVRSMRAAAGRWDLPEALQQQKLWTQEGTSGCQPQPYMSSSEVCLQLQEDWGVGNEGKTGMDKGIDERKMKKTDQTIHRKKTKKWTILLEKFDYYCRRRRRCCCCCCWWWWCFPTKILYAFLSLPCVLHAESIPSSLTWLIVLMICG